MGADGCRSIRMGADECMGKEGSKNKVKIAPNGGAVRVFLLCDHGEKKQEVDRDGIGGQRGLLGGMEGNQEARGAE